MAKVGRPKKQRAEEAEEVEGTAEPSQPIPPPEDPAGEEAPDPDEPTVDVKMRGRASKVAELITKRKKGGSRDDEPDADRAAVAPNDRRKLHQALQNPRNHAFVKRVDPARWPEGPAGVKVNYEVYSEDCPLSIQMITKSVIAQHGGGVFQLHVVDKETGQSIGATTFESNDDPIPKAIQTATTEFEEIPEGDPDEERMERQIRLNQKMITMETLNQQLADLKGQRTGGQGDRVIETKIARMESALISKTQQDAVAAVEAKYERQMAELRAELKALSVPKPVEDETKKSGFLEFMLEQTKQAAEERRAGEARFNQLIQVMNDQRLDSLKNEVRALQNTPARREGNFVDEVLKYKEIAKVLGLGSAGESDFEKPWYEELSEAVKSVAGTVSEFIKARSNSGQQITQEDFARQFAQTADNVAGRILQAAPRGLPAPVTIQAQATPVSAAGVPLVPVGGTFRSRSQAKSPVQEVVVPSPAPARPPAQPRPPVRLVEAAHAEVVKPAEVVAPTPPKPQVPDEAAVTIDEEIRVRVGSVLSVMDREMTLRTNRYTWVQFAWEEFPADLLDSIATCPDALAMIDLVMRTAGADPGPSVEKLRSAPKVVQWLNRGLADIKSWVETRNEDPDFDPFEEEEEEEPGGEGIALAPPPGVGSVVEESGNGEVG